MFPCIRAFRLHPASRDFDATSCALALKEKARAWRRAGVFPLLTGWLVMVHQMVAGVPIRFDRFENMAANRVIKPSPPHENQIHQERTLW
jgi:hypothetical protein